MRRVFDRKLDLLGERKERRRKAAESPALRAREATTVRAAIGFRAATCP